MEHEPRHSAAEIAAMLASVIAAIVVAVIILRHEPDRSYLEQDLNSSSQPQTQPQRREGVEARITAGAVTMQRQWQALDISLGPGESIDSEAPADLAFEAEITVRFRPRNVRYARIGALLQGGSVIIMRGGEVLLSDYADCDDAKVTLTQTPQRWSGRIEEVRYIFRAGQSRPVRLQAIWQPEDADEPMALGHSTRPAQSE